MTFAYCLTEKGLHDEDDDEYVRSGRGDNGKLDCSSNGPL